MSLANRHSVRLYAGTSAVPMAGNCLGDIDFRPFSAPSVFHSKGLPAWLRPTQHPGDVRGGDRWGPPLDGCAAPPLDSGAAPPCGLEERS
jgi:hypothetical protein